jgi:hypothetical protein
MNLATDEGRAGGPWQPAFYSEQMRRRLSVGVLVTVLVALIVEAYFSVARATGLPSASCTLDPSGNAIPESQMGLPNHWLVVLGLACMLLGHLFGYVRPIEDAPPARENAFSRTVFTLMLFIIFFGVSATLLYEALGVLRVGEQSILQPITYYTRCAIHYDIHPNPANLSETRFPLQTVVMIVSFCFLAGHWLWSPPRRGATDK